MAGVVDVVEGYACDHLARSVFAVGLVRDRVWIRGIFLLFRLGLDARALVPPNLSAKLFLFGFGEIFCWSAKPVSSFFVVDAARAAE